MEMETVQLALPEPPDTAAMFAEIKRVRGEWYDAIKLRWDTDEDYTMYEYLADREDMEQEYNREATRIDMMYRAYWGVR